MIFRNNDAEKANALEDYLDKMISEREARCSHSRWWIIRTIIQKVSNFTASGIIITIQALANIAVVIAVIISLIRTTKMANQFELQSSLIDLQKRIAVTEHLSPRVGHSSKETIYNERELSVKIFMENKGYKFVNYFHDPKIGIYNCDGSTIKIANSNKQSKPSKVDPTNGDQAAPFSPFSTSARITSVFGEEWTGSKEELSGRTAVIQMSFIFFDSDVFDFGKLVASLDAEVQPWTYSELSPVPPIYSRLMERLVVDFDEQGKPSETTNENCLQEFLKKRGW